MKNKIVKMQNIITKHVKHNLLLLMGVTLTHVKSVITLISTPWWLRQSILSNIKDNIIFIFNGSSKFCIIVLLK